MAQTSAQDNLKIMQTYFDLLFGKEMQPLLDMFADDITWFIVATGTTINGKEELKADAQNHWAASPDRVKKLVNLFATDEFTCLEYTSGGTLKAQANFGDIAIKPTGKKYELQCCFVFHFRADGKIDRVHEYFDMGTVTRQIGANADMNKEDCRPIPFQWSRSACHRNSHSRLPCRAFHYQVQSHLPRL